MRGLWVRGRRGVPSPVAVEIPAVCQRISLRVGTPTRVELDGVSLGVRIRSAGVGPQDRRIREPAYPIRFHRLRSVVPNADAEIPRVRVRDGSTEGVVDRESHLGGRPIDSVHVVVLATEGDLLLEEGSVARVV